MNRRSEVYFAPTFLGLTFIMGAMIKPSHLSEADEGRKSLKVQPQYRWTCFAFQGSASYLIARAQVFNTCETVFKEDLMKINKILFLYYCAQFGCSKDDDSESWAVQVAWAVTQR